MATAGSCVALLAALLLAAAASPVRAARPVTPNAALREAPPAPPPQPQCMWREYHRNKSVSAWEFQLAPHRHMVRDRDRAIHRAEGMLRRLSAAPGSSVQFVEQSRWTTIYEEVAYQVRWFRICAACDPHVRIFASAADEIKVRLSSPSARRGDGAS
ncbi:MAG: hypothetical protein J3K34DRAFT_408369 [Monoraphidium minutum]|nr:MAG: hypothetical protein J3K34DRAFT_408369 [Monoraphidium minutum]